MEVAARSDSEDYNGQPDGAKEYNFDWDDDAPARPRI
jgi:hypothetical protein